MRVIRTWTIKFPTSRIIKYSNLNLCFFSYHQRNIFAILMMKKSRKSHLHKSTFIIQRDESTDFRPKGALSPSQTKNKRRRRVKIARALNPRGVAKLTPTSIYLLSAILQDIIRFGVSLVAYISKILKFGWCATKKLLYHNFQ